jgi:hypothetical protein
MQLYAILYCIEQFFAALCSSMQFYHCSEQLEWFEQIQIPEQIFTFADECSMHLMESMRWKATGGSAHMALISIHLMESCGVEAAISRSATLRYFLSLN